MYEFTVDHSMRRGWRIENSAAKCTAMVHKTVLGLSLALACQISLAQVMYRIKPLGTLGGCTTSAPVAAGLNGANHVTGSACNANGDIHAFLWKNDGNPMVDLGPDEMGSTSHAVDLNASGLAAGYAQDSTGEFAFLSSGNGTPMRRIPGGLGGSDIYPTAVNDLGQLTGTAYPAGNSGGRCAFLWKNDGSPMLLLGTVGCGDSGGNAINASGQIAGSVEVNYFVSHAFVWKNDGTSMLDLGILSIGLPPGPGIINHGLDKSDASAINASGEVAGTSSLVRFSNVYFGKRAFLWRNDGTPIRDLGTLGGMNSYFIALNDSGQVAGVSNPPGSNNLHAFVWMNDGTPMQDLGTLGGTSSYANGINSSGQVTGYATLAGDAVSHAFLWRNDGKKKQDLNKLIDPTDPLKPYVTLAKGDFINDSGDIVAEGTDRRTGNAGLYLLQGTVLALSPRSLMFGNHPINTSSTAKSVTVTNTGSRVVAITSIALTGTASGQFVATNNCGNSLVGHTTCTIKVTFRPTTKGVKPAALNINGGDDGLLAIKITGTGT